MNSQEGGVSDWMALSETRPRQNGPDPGWGTLGSALGGGIQAAGQQANLRGMQTGAQTMLAMAAARQRVDQNQGTEAMYQQVQNNPQMLSAIGLDPQSAGLIKNAMLASGGKFNPLQYAQSANTGEKTNLMQTVANPQTAALPRNNALAALAPAAALPKAVGVNGSSFAPAIGPGGQSTVGPLQQNLTQSEIGQHNAAAAAVGQNAQTNAAKAQTAAAAAAAKGAQSGHRLMPGYTWAQDANGQVVMNPDGTPKQVPNPNAGTGEYAQLYSQRVVGSAGELAMDAKNISDFGITTQGYGGLGAEKGGLYEVGANILGRKLSTTTQQQYKATMSGVGRFITSLENMGLVPRGSMSQQVQDAVTGQPGDTGMTLLYKEGLVRQYIEGIHDAVMTGSGNQAAKTAYAKALGSVQKSIPFLPSDVRLYQAAVDRGFSGGIGQFMKQQQSGQGSAQFHAPAATQGPAVGAIEQGYKFTGGDPSKPSSWQKVP